MRVTASHTCVPCVAQSSELSHPITLESLASRVCRGDTSLYNSEQQFNSYDTLKSYLNKDKDVDDDGYSGDGFQLALLCIFMWITVIAKEFDAIFHDAVVMCHQLGSKFSSIPALLLPCARQTIQ